MKAEFHIDAKELASFIVEALRKELEPLLNTSPQEDILFTVKTLAEYLQVSDQWVYERVRLNEIPFIKIGKFPRFRKSDIDSWLNTLKTPALQPLAETYKLRLLHARDNQP